MQAEHFRRLILAEKARRGMTYEDLEWETGVSRTTIHSYLKRRRDITVQKLFKILDGLGIELAVRRKKDGKQSAGNEVQGVQ